MPTKRVLLKKNFLTYPNLKKVRRAKFRCRYYITSDVFTIQGGTLSGSTITKDYYEDEMPMMSPDYGPCSWDEMEAMEAAHELTEAYYDMTGKMGAMANRISKTQ